MTPRIDPPMLQDMAAELIDLGKEMERNRVMRILLEEIERDPINGFEAKTLIRVKKKVMSE